MEIEMRHILRKHVLTSFHKGKAVLMRCTECLRTGPDTPEGIVHTSECRYAKLLSALGEGVRMDSPNVSLIKNIQTMGATHDPISAALECSS
jgi:hypothetical protein